MDFFKDQVQNITDYLYDMGADASPIRPVRWEAIWADAKLFAFHRQIFLCPAARQSPAVSDLAFSQLLRPELASGDIALGKHRYPFPLRILSDLGVDYLLSIAASEEGLDIGSKFHARSQELATALNSITLSENRPHNKGASSSASSLAFPKCLREASPDP